MPQIPQPTQGNSRYEDASNKVIAHLRSLRPQRGFGTQTTHSPFGTTRKSSGNQRSRAAGVFIYRITALYSDDYFGAQLFDEDLYDETKDFTQTHSIPGDPSLSGEELIVAKCLTGQMLDKDIIDGFNITYTYSDENLRAAEADVLGNEWQVCHPRYKLGDYVIVEKIQNGTNVKDGDFQKIMFMEMQPVREWCYQTGQTGP